MQIKDVIFSSGTSGFFFDDQLAIKAGADHDGFEYLGKPQLPGFKRIRIAGESVSVMIVLENGAIGVGDCAAVQYSGAGNRDPLFLADNYLPFLRQEIAPLLRGKNLTSFKTSAHEIDNLVFQGKKLHTAIRYGVTQALLAACAKAQNILMTEVICNEYKLPVIPRRVQVFAQSGDERYLNADKMIMKKVDVLPHALINHVDTKLGQRGEKLHEYVEWLVQRIKKLRLDNSYQPDLHIDVYGTIGIIFNNDAKKIAAYLKTLEKAAGEFALYIEGPVDVGGKEQTIASMCQIMDELARASCGVKIVADEWCNTYEDIREFTDAKSCHMIQIKTPDLGGIQNIVESVLYCKQHGVEAYQGGTCNETDISAKVCVHLAIAAQADRMLAKPGMGFDEGYCIVNNEMNRTLALLAAKYGVAK
jgi:methylaspartate ammonia-lyase